MTRHATWMDPILPPETPVLTLGVGRLVINDDDDDDDDVAPVDARALAALATAYCCAIDLSPAAAEPVRIKMAHALAGGARTTVPPSRRTPMEDLVARGAALQELRRPKVETVRALRKAALLTLSLGDDSRSIDLARAGLEALEIVDEGEAGVGMQWRRAAATRRARGVVLVEWMGSVVDHQAQASPGALAAYVDVVAAGYAQYGRRVPTRNWTMMLARRLRSVCSMA